MERFDFVIVGGGHNGLTIAAYLAKSGAKVAVAESRIEIGGCMDFVEPRPGFVVSPHAAVNYGHAAPGFDQLDLWKFGHRVAPMRGAFMLVTSDNDAIIAPFIGQDPALANRALEILSKWSTRDVEMYKVLLVSIFPHLKEILRSVYWVPPWPRDLEYEPEDLPWVQQLSKSMPGVFGEDWLKMSLMELIDSLLECDPLKAWMMLLGSWQGPGAHWSGQAIPTFTGLMLSMYSHSTPVGGMHMFAHSLARCAMYYGAKFLTNSPVEEILVRDNRAVGIRLADQAQYKEKVLMADKAVVSAVDTQQTFLRLVGSDHLDPSFKQRVADIDMRGGAIVFAGAICKDYPRFQGNAGKIMAEFDTPPGGFIYPIDGVQKYAEYMRDVDGFRTDDSFGMATVGFLNMTNFDRSFVPEGFQLLDACTRMAPPPEYHRDGPDAMSFEKKEAYVKRIFDSLFQLAPNMRGAIVETFATTPLDQEFRNAGLAGSSWYGPSWSKDQWWNNRPLPELARYRAPIDRLYLCHQSQYPGGLCLMAVGYNLMHILIDDGLVQPGSWWYPSPWHVKDGEKKVPRLK